MRSLALLKCSWRNTCMGLWRRLWWGDRLNMQRWFIMEFLLFCQVLNTQGMSNLEVWISECLKHNEEVRIHLRKPLSNLPSPMWQYKFYFPFSGVENSRRCIFQHQTLVSTIHLRICCNRKKKKKKKSQQISSNQITCESPQKEKVLQNGKYFIGNVSSSGMFHCSVFVHVSIPICKHMHNCHHRFIHQDLNDPRDIPSLPFSSEINISSKKEKCWFS